MACKSSNVIDCPCTGLENLFVNATYFVDSQFGDDATAIPRDESHPYRTIAAVPVQPGEIVYVQPGNYSLPVLTLNNSIWYFSAGSTITTLVTGVGQIYGYGNFIGQSPAITFSSNVGQLTIYAQSITTPTGSAVVIDGGGRFALNVRCIVATDGILVDRTISADINVDEFIGDGVFIRATPSSAGSLCCHSQSVQCDSILVSQSNVLKFVLSLQTATTNGIHAYIISDPSIAASNTAIYNIDMSRLICLGVVNISGLSGVQDVLLQPNLNLNIQNIVSRNSISILGLNSFVNLTFDSFSYSSTFAIPHIVIIGEGCVMHMNGAKVYNSSSADIGFATISANNYSSLRCKFTECYATSQLLECTGASESQLDIMNLTVISSQSREIIVNSGQCIVNIHRFLTQYSGGTILVGNSGLMQFNIGAWQCNADSCKFLVNSARLQSRIGFFVTEGSGNTFLEAAGTITGIAFGSIRMDGSNNVGIVASGPVLMDVGQILSNNSGNLGIRVEDPGQLYGRVSRIIMQDQSCIEFKSSADSNISFDWMTNRSNSYVIYVDGRGEVTMSGNSITAQEVKYPIFIVAENSKFNLKLLRMDIINCAAGVYIQAINSDIRIDIQHFFINGDAGIAGIYAEAGKLTLKGNYFMETSSNVPLLRLTGDVVMKASLTFVDVGYSTLISDTRGSVWYEASETNSRNSSYNVILDIPDSSQVMTVKGLFRTDGDYNVYVNSSSVSFIRAIDGIFISRSRNLGTATPMNVICNYSIGNAGLDNFTSVPAGGFVTDPGVQ